MNVAAKIEEISQEIETVDDFLNMLVCERELVYKIALRESWYKRLTKRDFLKNYPFIGWSKRYSSICHEEYTISFGVDFEATKHLTDFSYGKLFDYFGVNIICGGWAGNYYGQFILDAKKFPIMYKKITRELALMKLVS